MNNTSPINDKLKNVFNEESASAIRNVNTITPPPEKAKSGEQSNSDLELRKLRNYIKEQDQRITVLIESQNKLIGEFNALESAFKELKRRVTQQTEAPVQAPLSPSVTEPQTEEELTVSKEKQQTGAGEGLKNQEYSVEKFFYFGSK